MRSCEGLRRSISTTMKGLREASPPGIILSRPPLMPSRDFIAEFFPLLIAWSLFAGIGIVVGKKKGVSPMVAILGSFPLWVAIFAIWLVRKPDIEDS